MIKYIITTYPKLTVFSSNISKQQYNFIKLTPIDSPILSTKLCEELIELEKKEIDLFAKYKFGILYVKDGQVNEEDMFSNGNLYIHEYYLNKLVESSCEFQEFLSFLGKKIELKGFQGYNGGLDTRSNLFI